MEVASGSLRGVGNHHWKVGQDGFSARVAQMRGGAGAERLHGGLDLAQRRPLQRGALVTSRHVWFFSVSWRSGDRPARGRERSRRGVIVHAGGQGGAGGAAPLLRGALCRGLIPDETLESPWRELPGRRRCTLSTGTSARSRGLPAAAGLMRFRPVASGAGAQAFAGPLVGPRKKSAARSYCSAACSGDSKKPRCKSLPPPPGRVPILGSQARLVPPGAPSSASQARPQMRASHSGRLVAIVSRAGSTPV